MSGVNKRLVIIKFFLKIFVNNKRDTFIEACKNPRASQDRVKEEILSLSKFSLPQMPVDYNFYKNKETTYKRIRFFETTSGSTGNKKLIPYTSELLSSFQNMFLLWIHDLIFHSNIHFESGKFFMSISPRIGEDSTDDRKYISPLLKLILDPFLVSNPSTHSAKTGNEFIKKIATDLREAKDLEAISIWSPTYLLTIIEELSPLNAKELWPRLKLISCWTEAQADRSARRLKEIFPGVLIQSKGLLLTEGPVTIPWTAAGGNIPLITEAVYELYDGERLIPIYDGIVGKEYVIVMTQKNGFLRYDTKDKVLVTGYYHKVPILVFKGRTGVTVDLAGEKFSEEMIDNIFCDLNENFLIVPDVRKHIPGYVFLSSYDDSDLEKRLLSFHHYRLARELKQLLPLRTIKITNPFIYYRKFLAKEGMSMGNIKESLLVTDLSSAEKFLNQIDNGLLKYEIN